jgi:hypothetical protein
MLLQNIQDLYNNTKNIVLQYVSFTAIKEVKMSERRRHTFRATEIDGLVLNVVVL